MKSKLNTKMVKSSQYSNIHSGYRKAQQVNQFNSENDLINQSENTILGIDENIEDNPKKLETVYHTRSKSNDLKILHRIFSTSSMQDQTISNKHPQVVTNTLTIDTLAKSKNSAEKLSHSTLTQQPTIIIYDSNDNKNKNSTGNCITINNPDKTDAFNDTSIMQNYSQTKPQYGVKKLSQMKKASINSVQIPSTNTSNLFNPTYDLCENCTLLRQEIVKIRKEKMDLKLELAKCQINLESVAKENESYQHANEELEKNNEKDSLYILKQEKEIARLSNIIKSNSHLFKKKKKEIAVNKENCAHNEEIRVVEQGGKVLVEEDSMTHLLSNSPPSNSIKQKLNRNNVNIDKDFQIGIRQVEEENRQDVD